MSNRQHWSLGAKLALVGLPFILLALLSTALTLWVSWQLDGGAAAVNEAGRMRMQAYRMSLSVGTGDAGALPQQAQEFEQSLALLRKGDPERPLFVPWDDTVQKRFVVLEQDWQRFRARWIGPQPRGTPQLQTDTVAFTDHINAFVQSIEAHISRWTAILHLLQASLFAMVILAAVALLYTGHAFVLEPLEHLKLAIEKIRGGDFDARVEPSSTDEFGSLAEGFNEMAGQLQSMYRHLESKVAEKTAELEDKRERLASLYEVTALVASAKTVDELTRGFVESMRRIAHADGVALRWCDADPSRFLMLASVGLPAALLHAEHCIQPGACECGNPADTGDMQVIPIHTLAGPDERQCHKAGFETVVSIPVHMHDQQVGELDLFFHARTTPSPTEHSLFVALLSHLAGAMDNLRLQSLETETAVSQERHLLARELHDSIAQSLAFLKIQVQLMRDAVTTGDQAAMARVLEEIDAGVRESYGDVRELLLHFRTRASAEGIEPALATTLRKFEHQSGIASQLQIHGQGLPLSPELQIQVLHIVQEALSNVRKHSRASRVWVEVQQQPDWRIEVRDDGLGFSSSDTPDETHVGLGIMRERAERIGASVDILSTPQRGTSVVLTLPPQPAAQSPAALTAPVLEPH